MYLNNLKNGRNNQQLDCVNDETSEACLKRDEIRVVILDGLLAQDWFNLSDEERGEPLTSEERQE